MADNKIFQKKANISLVMQTIRVKKEISRIDISRELGLDRSTITNIVTKLIDQELLVEKSQGSSVPRGGRRPVFLGINPSFGLVLGLEIQVKFYRATLMSIDGGIIWSRSGSILTRVGLLNTFKNIYLELEKDIKDEKSPLLGIGLGLPGHIDPIKGKILSSCPFYISEEQNNNFSMLFDIPVILDNDANCCAWGVLENRKGSGLKNFLYSIIELHGKGNNLVTRDIGFGIVVNGEIYYGSNFAAGELGDSLAQDDDDESYYKKLFNKLSLFISFLNPSHLFLGGEFINHRELVLKLVNEGSFNQKCEVVFSEFQEFEVSYGAASMFLERLFKIPGVDKSRESELTWDKIMNIRSKRGVVGEIHKYNL